MNLDESRRAKDEWRQRIWRTLLESGVSADPFNRIPDFEGAGDAAARLRRLREWRAATTLKVVPDRAQEPVRRMALEDGKTLYMAVPRLAEPEPFYRLTLEELQSVGASAAEAAASRRALELGTPVHVSEMQSVDLAVLGSVVVNHGGVRVGKGAGYSDIELALLAEGGVLGSEAHIITTVHPLQLVDEELPEMSHDFRVDLIVTADGTVDCRPGSLEHRPSGLIWDHLDRGRVEEIPALDAIRR